jgi:hypothetical protein
MAGFESLPPSHTWKHLSINDLRRVVILLSNALRTGRQRHPRPRASVRVVGERPANNANAISLN